MSPIDDALFTCLNERCDVALSTVSAGGQPTLCWGMGGRLLDDRRTVEAFVREDHARQCLANLRNDGRAALVFVEPFTNVAVQFKGRDTTWRPATREDEPFLRFHVDNMVRELARVQFNATFARAFFEQPWSLLAMVRFTADQVFVQTPGPQAGQPLGPVGA